MDDLVELAAWGESLAPDITDSPAADRHGPFVRGLRSFHD
jgi:hypothetical protein